MALIGSVNNWGTLQGQINSANGYLTGVISSAALMGGQVVGMRGLPGEKGDTGDTGNGIASVSKTGTVGLVDTYTITYTNGTTSTFTVTNGKDGTDGVDGRDGADGHSPIITTNRAGKTVTILSDGESIGTVEDGADGSDGQDGQDGFSPIANVSKVGDTSTITITDENGTTTATVKDGTDGTDGQDGYSPSATVSKVGDTATITITDKDGTTTATVSDGQDSADENVKQQYQAESGYSYWRPLLIGKSSNSTEGFTPTSTTDQTYTFKTLEVQPSSGTIRMGKASFFNGSYTHKVSPTTLTANRTATLPNKSGTIAFTDDIPPLVIDLGNIDPSEYEDDIEVFLNTLLQDGAYRFVWEDGDDYEYYVVVESMLDYGFVYQKYWYSEEGSNILYHCSLRVEDGEVVERSAENYMTLTDASIMFAIKNHVHYDNKNAAMTVLDWCDSNALTFDNTKPFILYTDTLNSKNWIIERYATVRQPNYRFIRVYDMSDASHFYIRSGSLVGNSTVWGSWKEYKDSSAYPCVPSGGTTNQVLAKNSNTDYDLKWVNQSGGGGSVNDVEVNGTSVVSGGVADISISAVGLSNDYDDLDNLPTIPTKTSDLNNDSLFARGNKATFYGTCATAGATKTVTCADFKSEDLTAGVTIVVSFSVANTGAVADLTLNVNSTGAHHIKYNSAGTIANLGDKSYLKASTYMFYFDGTYWIITGYDTNTNTIGYTIRTNGLQLKTKTACYRYRLMFTSPDGQYFVPANSSTSTSSTASKTVTTEKIDPWGRIVYYGTTTAVAANSYPTTSYLYQQYNGVALGYSFNRTGSALTMTNHYPVYVKATPQSDGSAIIDGTTPFVQTLPSTEDGKIYIFLGIATAETTIEFTLEHPVYEYKGGKIRPYTNPDLSGKADVSHSHTKSDITDFSHTHTLSDISDYASDVYIATYNVTSYSDVLSAIASGKDVVCAYSVTSGAVTTVHCASLSDYTNGASTEEIVFSATDEDTITTLKVTDQDVWSNTTTTVPSNTSDLNNDSGFISEDANGNVNITNAYKSGGAYIGSYIKVCGASNTTTLSTSPKKIEMHTKLEGKGNAFSLDGGVGGSFGINCEYGGTLQVSGKVRVGSNYSAQDIVLISIYVNSTEVYMHRYRVPPNMTTPAQDITLPTIPLTVSASDKITLEVVNGTGARGTIIDDECKLYAMYIAPTLS